LTVIGHMVRAAVIILILVIGTGCGGDRGDYTAFYKGTLKYYQKQYRQAKVLLKDFLRHHPDSYLSGRAREYLEQAEELIRREELNKIREYLTFKLEKTFIQALAFSDQGNQLVLATDDGEFRFYHTQLSFDSTNIYENGKDEQTHLLDKTVWGPGYRFSVPFREVEVTSLAFSPNGKFLIAGFFDGTVGIWQAPDYKKIKLERLYRKSVRSITFSPDDRWMITSSEDGLMNVWDVSDTPRIYQRHKIESELDAVIFCPPNSAGIDYLAVATENYILIGSLRMEKAREGEIEFLAHVILPNKEGEKIKKLSFSAGGRRLASLHENNLIRIWNLDPKKIKYVLKKHDLLKSPLNWFLSKSNWKTWAAYWKAGWKFLEHQIRYEDSTFISMIMGHFGHLLITSQDDGSIVFWDVKKERILKTIRRTGSPIDYLLLSPDKRILVSASEYKTIILWNVSVDWNAIF
jgi:WD40 repeat protein